MGAGTDNMCGWCGSLLPHAKLTCSDCGLVYDDCEDSSGYAHPVRYCVTELKRLLAAEKAQPRHGCLGCPMAPTEAWPPGECPYCGNCVGP